MRISQMKTTSETETDRQKGRRQRQTYLGMKCIWVPVKTGFDCLLAIIFVLQIVCTGNAVAVRTKLAICETLTVTNNQQNISNNE